MLLYFAAPLFSHAEQQFNQTLATNLEALGFTVFLPQRDGAESHKAPYDTMSKDERRQAIFHLDKAKIFEADVFLFVLDGRVPDEGACVELGIAYCQRELQKANKLLIGLQTDKRAAFLGSKLNPMLRVPLDFIVEREDSLLNTLRYFLQYQKLPAEHLT
ncbi:MAG: nucleoside 2-deoxyribosyltransferase [Deinococcota bacterium]